MAENVFSIQEATEALLKALDERSRDVVTRRYGLASGTEETLESIGREYGITRERVRQIQSQAKKALLERDELLREVAMCLEGIFAKHGGLLAEQHAVKLAENDFANHDTTPAHVVFYLDVLSPYRFVSRDTHFDPHWLHPEGASQHGRAIVEAAQEVLKAAGHPVSEEVLVANIRQQVGDLVSDLPTEHIIAHLLASKTVDETPFGEWGLRLWPETHPRGVGDKAYVVLHRSGKPEHFTAITELINSAEFDHKRANPQTVHNELIKDKRFVLVGRGLYGLTEWGYISGTVADVIESLLKKEDRPLTREEVIDKVLEQRQVKKNTILLGLQNHNRFEKTPDNKFRLRANS